MLVDKFNRGYGNKNKKNLETEFSIGAKSIYENVQNSHKKLSDRIALIEDIRKKYDVTDSYFSTKKRRIVSVRPAVNENDVVIRQQLAEVANSLNRKIEDHIKDFIQFKEKYEK